jgi:hypothetical protein
METWTLPAGVYIIKDLRHDPRLFTLYDLNSPTNASLHVVDDRACVVFMTQTGDVYGILPHDLATFPSYEAIHLVTTSPLQYRFDGRSSGLAFDGEEVDLDEQLEDCVRRRGRVGRV